MARHPAWLLVVAFRCALPATLLLLPLNEELFLAMTLAMSIPSVLLTVLAVALLLLFDFVTRAVRWALPAVALLVVAVTIGVDATAGHDASHPQRYNLSYSVNADSGESGYVSMVFFHHP